MASLNKITCCSCIVLNVQNSLKGVNLTFVRFRKPRWVPKAASKIYKVREPTPIDPIEEKKMKEWMQVYGTERKSIKKYMHKHNEKLEAMLAIEKKKVPFDIVFKTMIVKNDAWNKEVAAIREADMSQITQQYSLRQQMLAEKDVLELEEIRSEARKRVMEAQEGIDNFVTPDNIDDVVEELLNSRTEYEFAISLDGSTVGTSVDGETNKDNADT